MSNPHQMMQIRSRKLGVLIYDSRIANRRGAEECAEAMGVSLDEYRSFEGGKASPSLPQLELLAVYLNMPLEHYWGRQAMSTRASEQNAEDKKRILSLRNKVIGASLRLARSNQQIELTTLARESGLSEDALTRYELGEAPIPLAELETLAGLLQTPLSTFYDHHGPISKSRAPQSPQAPQHLSPELQQFIARPINQPYLEIALRLSEMPVDKLRALAESLLDITF